MPDCVPMIALTGGPCGGKTTFMRELREQDPDAVRWLMVPEAAPLLFSAGLRARERAFQRAVVTLQIGLEEACSAAAKPTQMLLCHRGVLDPLAYWLAAGWLEREFFDEVGFGRAELIGRYSGVIHIRTAALGAEQHYRRWPDAHRPETIEQSATIDNLCIKAWCVHPRHTIIGNNYLGWNQKSGALHDALEHLVPSNRRGV